MDVQVKRYERGSNWSEPEVAELLQLWSDESVQTELLSCLRNQHVFNRMAQALQRRGVQRTGEQCREKIKKLKLEYRRIKVNKKTLRRGRVWKFYDILDRVLGSRPPSSPSSSTSCRAPSVPLVPSTCSPDEFSAGLHVSIGAGDRVMFRRPIESGQLLEVKKEELDTEDEVLVYQIKSEDYGDADSTSVVGGDQKEFREMERNGDVHAGRPSVHSAEDSPRTPQVKEEELEMEVLVYQIKSEDDGDVGRTIVAGGDQNEFREMERNRDVYAGRPSVHSAEDSPRIPQVKKEELDMEVLVYQIKSEGDGDAHGTSVAGGGQKEFGDMERNGDVYAGRPSGFSDQNVAGSSSAGVCPTAHTLVIRKRRVQCDEEVPKSAGAFRQKRRRRVAGVGLRDNRSLENALAGFLSWQRVMEERYLSVEEARLQQEMQAEEQRERQEERRAQQDREHELRVLSLLTGILNAANGMPDKTGAGRSGTSSDLVTCASTALSSRPTLHPSPDPNIHPLIPVTLWDSQMPQRSTYLSRRGNGIRQHQGILQEGYVLYHANKYDEDHNPDGIINLGTSENKLCSDLLQERLVQPDMLHIEPGLLQYADWKGHRFLREEVAKFLSKYCCSPQPLRAENVVVMNGCGSVFCALAAVLCDPGDAVLIPTPFYGAILEDLYLYNGVKLYCVPLDSEPVENDERPFQLTAAKLEQALQRAKKEGVNVRAVILMNPHNPLADIYTAEEMISFLEFAKKHELHAIVDEIYMLSVFGDDDSFSSVLSQERLPDPQRTHVMWGLSKDFAMSGLRLGTLYSENKEVVQALDQLGCFHGVAGSIQHQVAQLLRDEEWVNRVFLLENRRRLKEAHHYVTTELKRLGIPYLHRGTGFFIWADFTKYLKEHTFVDELRLWRCFLKHRVLVSCGQAFKCSSPGWFRVIFSDQRQRLEIGLERIRQTLEELQVCSILPDCENTRADNQESFRQSEKTTETTENKNTKDSDGNIKPKACSSAPRLLCESKRLLANDEDFVVLNCPSSESEGLDSLIGVLRQQMHSSDWLEKNKPLLAEGEDPAQADVFKELLERARME